MNNSNEKIFLKKAMLIKVQGILSAQKTMLYFLWWLRFLYFIILVKLVLHNGVTQENRIHNVRETEIDYGYDQ